MRSARMIAAGLLWCTALLGPLPTVAQVRQAAGPEPVVYTVRIPSPDSQIATIEAAQPDCPSLANMTATATLIAAAALMRRESRGGHYRSDFPDTLPDAQRSYLTLDQALAIRTASEPEKT